MKKTKIAVIGTVGLPANYGGFETLTKHLVEELSNMYDFTVYCSSKRYKKGNRPSTYKGATLKYIPLDANGIQSIFYDAWSIFKASFNNDVLLVLGVAGAWTFPFVRLFTNKKIIVSIDGIEWKRDKWSTLAKFYLWWAEKIAVRFSNIDISDNESIQNYTAMRYKTLSRIIEYGADHTLCGVYPKMKEIEKYPFLKTDYAVKVCRIEPENNVHIVLDAFSALPGRNLVVVGNWENSEYGKNLKMFYSKFENLHLIDPVYNQREIDIIRSMAVVYIHGHSAGGTNPSLVEAMYLELPVFAFDVSYNKITTENQAYYFNSSEDLKNLLKNTDEFSLSECAKKMKKIAERRYRWNKIALKYSMLIEESFETKHKINVDSIASHLNPKILKKYGLLHLQNNRLFDN